MQNLFCMLARSTGYSTRCRCTSLRCARLTAQSGLAHVAGFSKHIAAARNTAGLADAVPALDVVCLRANEAFLVVRKPMAESWSAEIKYDATGAAVGTTGLCEVGVRRMKVLREKV
eukprot:6350007-Prymnesium_polylepis.1